MPSFVDAEELEQLLEFATKYLRKKFDTQPPTDPKGLRHHEFSIELWSMICMALTELQMLRFLKGKD